MEKDHDDDSFAAGSMAKNRVEALVDGIFGVAMTLLVLDVKLPQGLPLDTDAAMRAQLLGLTGNFRIYLISFVVLGLYWIGHHMQFHLVRSVDRMMLWINLCFMFGVTMIPFSTSVLGEYGDLRSSAIVYGLNLLWLALVYWIQISYLERNPHLATAALTPVLAQKIKRRVMVFIAVPVISVAVAFYDAWIAVHLYFVMAIVGFLPGKITRSKPGTSHAKAPIDPPSP
ncbi:MAG: TMEM175 family protein [Casimicrobiaceae bacterium]